MLALADGAEVQLAQASKGAAKSDAEKSNVPQADDKKREAGKSAETGKAAAQTPPAQPPAGATPETQTPGNQTPGAQTPPAQRPVEYEPLSKVSDKIRNSVAAQKAEHKVDDAFTALRLQMDQFGRQMDIYHRNQTRGDTSAKAPAPLDFAALAKQHGLEAKQTDLITAARGG